MIMGAEMARRKLEKEIEDQPLVLCCQNMKQVDIYTFLGIVISSRGVGESVTASVNSKIGKVKQLISEIRAVVEGCRNATPGGFCTSIEIWETAVIPYLYNAVEGWVEVPKEP